MPTGRRRRCPVERDRVCRRRRWSPRARKHPLPQCVPVLPETATGVGRTSSPAPVSHRCRHIWLSGPCPCDQSRCPVRSVGPTGPGVRSGGGRSVTSSHRMSCSLNAPRCGRWCAVADGVPCPGPADEFPEERVWLAGGPGTSPFAEASVTSAVGGQDPQPPPGGLVASGSGRGGFRLPRSRVQPPDLA